MATTATPTASHCIADGDDTAVHATIFRVVEMAATNPHVAATEFRADHSKWGEVGGG
jgi:hypothetical protein